MVGPVSLAWHGTTRHVNKNAAKHIFIILFNVKLCFSNLVTLNSFFIKITEFMRKNNHILYIRTSNRPEPDGPLARHDPLKGYRVVLRLRLRPVTRFISVLCRASDGMSPTGLRTGRHDWPHILTASSLCPGSSSSVLFPHPCQPQAMHGRPDRAMELEGRKF
jgi:hypothetical protein